MKIASSLLLATATIVVARVPEAAPNEKAPPMGVVSGRVDFMMKATPQGKYPDGFVYLQRRGKRVAPVPVKQVIHQRNKAFHPKLLVVPMGSTIAFPNEDTPGVSHNVFSPTAPVFDLSRYATGQSRSQAFPADGEFDIYCDVHPNMEAKIKVVDADLIAPVIDGKFTLSGVPPGTYKLIAWAPESPESKQTITVVEGTNVVPDPLHVQLGPPKTSHLNKKNQPYPNVVYPGGGIRKP